MSGSAKCRSCQRPVIWVKTETGSNMPLDASSSADGNVVLVASSPRDAVCWVVTPSRPAPQGMPLYKSHFATCPNAASHRRKEAGE